MRGAALVERLRVTSRPGDEARLQPGCCRMTWGSRPLATWLLSTTTRRLLALGRRRTSSSPCLPTITLKRAAVTRQRPKCPSSRRILYGELSEMDRGLLDDERLRSQRSPRRGGGGKAVPSLSAFGQGLAGRLAVSPRCSMRVCSDVTSAPHLSMPSSRMRYVYRRMRQEDTTATR